MLHNGKLTDIAKKHFTEDEISLVEQANTAVTHDMNQQRIVSEIYSARQIEQSNKTLIKCIEKSVLLYIDAAKDIAKSNTSYAKALNLLTLGLLLVGVIQVYLQYSINNAS